MIGYEIEDIRMEDVMSIRQVLYVFLRKEKVEEGRWIFYTALDFQTLLRRVEEISPQAAQKICLRQKCQAGACQKKDPYRSGSFLRCSKCAKYVKRLE